MTVRRDRVEVKNAEGKLVHTIDPDELRVDINRPDGMNGIINATDRYIEKHWETDPKGYTVSVNLEPEKPRAQIPPTPTQRMIGAGLTVGGVIGAAVGIAEIAALGQGAWMSPLQELPAFNIMLISTAVGQAAGVATAVAGEGLRRVWNTGAKMIHRVPTIEREATRATTNELAHVLGEASKMSLEAGAKPVEAGARPNTDRTPKRNAGTPEPDRAGKPHSAARDHGVQPATNAHTGHGW